MEGASCGTVTSAHTTPVDPPAVMTGRSEWTQQSSTALNAVVLVSSDFLSPAPSIPRGLARPWLYSIMKTSATNHFSSTKHTALFNGSHKERVDVCRKCCWFRPVHDTVRAMAGPAPCDASQVGLLLPVSFRFSFICFLLFISLSFFLSAFPTLYSFPSLYILQSFCFLCWSFTSVCLCLHSRNRHIYILYIFLHTLYTYVVYKVI
jgi:hypothetical protein